MTLTRRLRREEGRGIRRGGKGIGGGWDGRVEVVGRKGWVVFGGCWVDGSWIGREGEGDFVERSEKDEGRRRLGQLEQDVRVIKREEVEMR